MTTIYSAQRESVRIYIKFPLREKRGKKYENSVHL
nr:MAG TPA: hypothetical protein [Caudoviricetes sp.]